MVHGRVCAMLVRSDGLLTGCMTRRSGRKRVVHSGGVLYGSCSRTWLCLGGNRLNLSGCSQLCFGGHAGF